MLPLHARPLNTTRKLNRGMAWFYRYYAKELMPEDATAYEQAEASARKERRGLWDDESPVEPWNFRRDKTAVLVSPPPMVKVTGPIIGNRNSKIYHLLNCPDYNKVAERNRVLFKTEAEAQ